MRRVIKKTAKIALIVAIVTISLTVLLVLLARTYIHVGPYKSWEERGIGVLLPSLSDAIGKSEDEFYIEGSTRSNSFNVTVYGVTQEDFIKYADAVMESGFTVNYSRSDDRLRADHITIIRRKSLLLLWFDEEDDPYEPPRMYIGLA